MIKLKIKEDFKELSLRNIKETLKSREAKLA